MEPAVAPAFIAFTICSRNFLAQAQVLHDSLRRHHPGVHFYVALCDEPTGVDFDGLPFDILRMSDLGIPQLAQMTERYNITELNTAIKPFAFLTLFDRHPGAAVAYFDPDIWVMSPLEELHTLLSDGGADCVLTPHLCEPAEYAEMDESKMLRFGIYNLGFCALRDTATVRRVAAWWARRLETHCIIDLAAGFFVDQKWADLLPAFIEHTAILRHPGYNVAYWNLAQRTVRAPAEPSAGGWKVNGAPLRFFHFSGSAVDEDSSFSRHSQQFRTEALRDVGTLFEQYRSEVRRFGREDYRRIPYAFRWNGAGQENEHSPSSLQDFTAVKGAAASSRPLTIEARAPNLPVLRARSQGEMSAFAADLAPKMARRRAFEASLVPNESGEAGFTVEGQCVVCGGTRPLQVNFNYATGRLPDGRTLPNWREHLACTGCGLGNRLRASLHLLWQELRPRQHDRIYITEQVTPLHDWLRQRFPFVVGSEYLGPGHTPGEIVDGLRHEDVHRLSFPDAGLDLILSFDVLEHVPDARQALAEFWRCLKPGGSLLFTAPFREDLHSHLVRAVLRPDGSIEHLMEPEFHGNPVDPEGGSLCFQYFGWKIIEDLSAVGFSDAEGLFYWSAQFMYLGGANSVFIARKPL
ncbi:class I SAM-dependent methyltransferase [Roseomonas terrae]|uniref:Class I SAM-dependent methyltransferase n=1 Tax=Neoroseomonas terrae TaxID=424799 RepID=A0ABS5EIL7_9PROT|nr:class I SAM-dependent methyltransferase [Neoroseomonas terrae]MBR0650843.1 class I SAM-dependent methyltransferase [Neoroseomonas terrae]